MAVRMRVSLRGLRFGPRCEADAISESESGPVSEQLLVVIGERRLDVEHDVVEGCMRVVQTSGLCGIARLALLAPRRLLYLTAKRLTRHVFRCVAGYVPTSGRERWIEGALRWWNVCVIWRVIGRVMLAWCGAMASFRRELLVWGGAMARSWVGRVPRMLAR